MKRTEALVPLSHDHHHGLVVALRLKKGGPASWRDPWPADPEGQRTALLAFAESELLPHFALEEALVFPACYEATPVLCKETEALAIEHNQMRDLLDRIRSADLAGLPEMLKSLGTILEAHIRKEERLFFPLVEEGIASGIFALDADELARRHARQRPAPGCDV